MNAPLSTTHNPQFEKFKGVGLKLKRKGENQKKRFFSLYQSECLPTSPNHPPKTYSTLPKGITPATIHFPSYFSPFRMKFSTVDAERKKV